MAFRSLPVLISRRRVMLRCLSAAGLGALGLPWVANVAQAAAIRNTGHAPPAPEAALPDPALAALTLLVQTFYPHAVLEPAVYGAVAGAMTAQVAADPASKAVLDNGLRELEAAAPGGWLACTAAQRAALLAQREATPFFQFVRGSAAFLLYTRPDVWKAFGYGGDAWSVGGYGPREVNSIDWLPDPAPLT